MRSHVAHEIGRRHAGVGQISLESLCRVVPCNVHCMPTLPRPQHREQTAASAECVAHSGVGSPQAAARARSGGCVDLGDTRLAGASQRFVARRNSVRMPSSARDNRSDDASCAYEAQCFVSSGLKRPSILCVVPLFHVGCGDSHHRGMAATRARSSPRGARCRCGSVMWRRRRSIRFVAYLVQTLCAVGPGACTTPDEGRVESQQRGFDMASKRTVRS